MHQHKVDLDMLNAVKLASQLNLYGIQHIQVNLNTLIHGFKKFAQKNRRTETKVDRCFCQFVFVVFTAKFEVSQNSVCCLLCFLLWLSTTSTSTKPFHKFLAHEWWKRVRKCLIITQLFWIAFPFVAVVYFLSNLVGIFVKIAVPQVFISDMFSVSSLRKEAFMITVRQRALVQFVFVFVQVKSSFALTCAFTSPVGFPFGPWNSRHHSHWLYWNLLIPMPFDGH